ncbi:GH17788 [Drosophila grimshawi]|uniref:GH17788 n=1 Tax=Drosophila grimshawi TaxID=7222 RepID=B4JXR2_DROGR|nr:GH17788 [Drosophila grimshawi]
MSTTTSNAVMSTCDGFATARVSCASPVPCCSRAVSHKITRTLASPVNYWLLAAMLIIFTTCLLTSTDALPARVVQGEPVRSEFHCKTPNVNDTRFINEVERSKSVYKSLAKSLLTWLINSTNMTIEKIRAKYVHYRMPLNYSLAHEVSVALNRSSSNEAFGDGMTKMEQIFESVTKMYLLVNQTESNLTTPLDKQFYCLLKKKVTVLMGTAKVLGDCSWNETLANSFTYNTFGMKRAVALEVLGLTKVVSEYYAGMRESETP